ncbi:MAG: NmrA family NAD(P)-binding protein, partial [Cyanothece sp. SIO1E1]|nr:NmrA family NAD(P)-binding protein [Cyanothece sp. SIO1E1]
MTAKNSSTWDLGRFVKTLSYFGQIPFLSNMSWFQYLLGNPLNQNLDSAAIAYGQTSTPTKSTGVVLVVGATGGVGKRVVQPLVTQGYQVRSLVRDAKRAES